MKNSAAEWDKAAAGFQSTYNAGMNDYNRRLLRFIKEKGMITNGCSVLDIGCGVGIYAKALSDLGCNVTLMDISREMLRYAERNMADCETLWRTVLCDFSEYEPNGETYDFSIAAMSPAVCDEKTLCKMSAVTSGTCLLTRFISWEQPDRDAVLKLAGLEPYTDTHAGDTQELIRLITKLGFEPHIEYSDYCWSDDMRAEEAAKKIAERLNRNASEEELRCILKAAAKLCRDGIFTDRVNTKVAWIYWKTKRL